jgi:large subunit ribosomal protein L4
MKIIIPANNGNSDVESVAVSNTVFGQEFNEPLIHQLIVAYMAAARSGTTKQKNRSEVSGGGAKPWKQKGSGRARAGSSRSPLWRSGGVTFASSNRDYRQKLNRKMYRVGMRSILSELLRQQRMEIYDDVFPASPKTKELFSKLKKYEDNRILIIVDTFNSDLFLAARNLPNIEVCISSSINPVVLVNSDKVILTSQAVKLIEERLA